MNSPQAFDEEKYQALVCGLECTEGMMSELEESFRIDAEFFKKKYTYFDRWVKTVNHSSLQKESSKTCKGIFDINASIYTSEGIPFVRISNLRDMLIDDSDIVYIPKNVDAFYPNTHLKYGDVILSKTAIATASFVNLSECNVSQDTVAIKLKKSSKLRSAFLTVFLNTKYGISAMERRFTGNIQMHLNLTECKEKLFIPIFNDIFQESIQKLLLKAISLRNESSRAYHAAETLLLTSLNLQNFTPSTKNTSVKSFSETFASGRLDAEYYQAKYDDLLERLHSQAERTILVNEICIINRRGIQPEYIDNGEIAVVNSKNILENGLDYENFSSTSSHLWKENPNAHIEKDDILIYTTGANIGRTAIYEKTLPAIASNHVNILRIKYEHPQYIAFVLNSMIGRLQTERISTGSAQQELYPKDIDNFVVPLVSENIQIGIEKLLNDSYILYEQSKNLLKAATRAVEIAIEESEAAALRYLEKMT